MRGERFLEGAAKHLVSLLEGAAAALGERDAHDAPVVAGRGAGDEAVVLETVCDPSCAAGAVDQLGGDLAHLERAVRRQVEAEQDLVLGQ